MSHTIFPHRLAEHDSTAEWTFESGELPDYYRGFTSRLLFGLLFWRRGLRGRSEHGRTFGAFLQLCVEINDSRAVSGITAGDACQNAFAAASERSIRCLRNLLWYSEKNTHTHDAPTVMLNLTWWDLFRFTAGAERLVFTGEKNMIMYIWRINNSCKTVIVCCW